MIPEIFLLFFYRWLLWLQITGSPYIRIWKEIKEGMQEKSQESRKEIRTNARIEQRKEHSLALQTFNPLAEQENDLRIEHREEQSSSGARKRAGK